jgi:SagB-type dehydrogenase family enzyme
VLTWQKGRIQIFDARTRTTVTALPHTAAVLSSLDRWARPEEVHRRLPEYTAASLDRALAALERRGLVLREGSADAEAEVRFQKVWGEWPEAAYFHFATKDFPYGTNKRMGEAMLRRFLETSPQPAFFKNDPDADRLELDRPGDRGELYRTLLRRRTHRRFGRGFLSIAQLSRLLYYTFGVTDSKRVPVLGRLPLKTSPSGGSRHSIEVYVVALRVAGLPQGIYHYASSGHALERIQTGVMKHTAVRFCAGQEWTAGAAALFVLTSVFPRVMWKYRFARAYRVVLAEAGHLSQTLCLLATQLQLAPFCTMAIDESVIEERLGLDGVEESPLYVTGVGLLSAKARR